MLTGAVRRVPVGVVTAGMFALQGAGVLVLLAAGSSTAGVVGFVLLFGIGFGVGTIARPALVARRFGVTRFATLAGLLGLITTLATTAGPVAAGIARTLTGSYAPVLVGILGLCTAAAASLLRADHLATRQTDDAVRDRAPRGGTRNPYLDVSSRTTPTRTARTVLPLTTTATPAAVRPPRR